ncbi:MAG: hypothetical protein U0230_17655 [Polyangiales bacterium]
MLRNDPSRVLASLLLALAVAHPTAHADEPAPAADSAPAIPPAPAVDSAPAAGSAPQVELGRLDTDPRDVERRPTKGGRAQLVVGMSLLGAGVALELCGLVPCDHTRAWAGATLLGLGAGLGVSLLATPREGIPAGQASALNSGGWMGTLVGFEVAGLVSRYEADGSFVHYRAPILGVLGGQLGGIALGYGLDRVFRPRPGEVAMGDSAGIWLTGLVVGTVALANDGFDGNRTFVRALMGGMLASTTAGLVGGAVLGRHVRASRQRVLLIDAGGILGAGTSALLAWLVRGNDLTGRGVAGSLIGGAVIGLGGTYVLTRNWDRRETEEQASPVSFQVSPTQGGAVAMVSGKLR